MYRKRSEGGTEREDTFQSTHPSNDERNTMAECVMLWSCSGEQHRLAQEIFARSDWVQTFYKNERSENGSTVRQDSEMCWLLSAWSSVAPVTSRT